MSTAGKIQCDLCRFVGDLECFNGKAQMRTPAGWFAVYPMVRIAGEKKLEPKAREDLRIKIKTKFPDFHICPRCCQDRKVYDAETMLPDLRGET